MKKPAAEPAAPVAPVAETPAAAPAATPAAALAAEQAAEPASPVERDAGARTGPRSADTDTAPVVRFTIIPPMEGTLSLGIYDAGGRLVRVLHREADESALEPAENGVEVTWDGKNDAGETCPAGTYRARGVIVGDLEMEGVDFLGNDWVSDESSPHITRIDELSLDAKGRPLLAVREICGVAPARADVYWTSGAGMLRDHIYGSDLDQVTRRAVYGVQLDPAPAAASGESEPPAPKLLPARELAALWEKEAADGDKQAVPTGTATGTSAGTTTGTSTGTDTGLAARSADILNGKLPPPPAALAGENPDRLAWKIEGRAVRLYNSAGQLLRTLPAEEDDPAPARLVATPDGRRAFVLYESPHGQRLHGVDFTGIDAANPDAEPRELFLNDIWFANTYIVVDSQLRFPDDTPFRPATGTSGTTGRTVVRDTDDESAAPFVPTLAVQTAPNPFLPRAKRRPAPLALRLGMEYRAAGASAEPGVEPGGDACWLTTGDGLPLTRVSATRALRWAVMGSPAEKANSSASQSSPSPAPSPEAAADAPAASAAPVVPGKRLPLRNPPITVFCSDGAVIEQYQISRPGNMMVLEEEVLEWGGGK